MPVRKQTETLLKCDKEKKRPSGLAVKPARRAFKLHLKPARHDLASLWDNDRGLVRLADFSCTRQRLYDEVVSVPGH